MSLLKEDWAEWLDHPCTKDFIFSLGDTRQEGLENMFQTFDARKRDEYAGAVHQIDLILAKLNSLKEPE